MPQVAISIAGSDKQTNATLVAAVKQFILDGGCKGVNSVEVFENIDPANLDDVRAKASQPPAANAVITSIIC